jgi:transcriptional regulator with XRE-family HTH domain
MPQLLRELLRTLREEQHLSRSALSRRTVRPGFEGIPEATIQAYETRPGQVPSAQHLEALAGALGVDPASFYEWPIAAARVTARPSIADRARTATQRLGDTPATSRRTRRAAGDEDADR